MASPHLCCLVHDFDASLDKNAVWPPRVAELKAV